MDTAEQIRAATLAVWAAQPARLREDANAEEDARRALGHRALVELVQNAVDASGAGARVRIEVLDGALRVLDAGSGLTGEGLSALCSLRASAKRSGVGRFGTGFAAVLALSDAPEIHSTLGSFGWSAELTRQVADVEGHVPVLRLPFTVAPRPVPAGWVTLVHLPLRPGVRVAPLESSVALTLPGLARLELPDRVLEVRWGAQEVSLAGTDWHWVSRPVTLPAQLQAELPFEQRDRVEGEVRVLAPVGGWPAGVPQVLHAPQPTDVVLSLPLLVSAPFPVAPDRRRVESGPLTDWLVEQVASCVGELAARLATDPAVLDLVPVGFATGELDAALRAAVLRRLQHDPPVRGSVLDLGDATLPAHPLVADIVADLLPVSWPVRHPALGLLGIARLGTADVVELLGAAGLPAARLPAVYDVLYDAPDREALRSLPVALDDGRVVTGARGAFLPGPHAVRLVEAGVDLRVLAHAHPLLLRIGAGEATASALLEEPAVREAVEQQESVELADAVLALVAEAGGRTFTADLVLSDDEGEPACAADLVLPGAPLVDVLLDSPLLVGPSWVQRWGVETLIACGVGWLPRLTDNPLLLSDSEEWFDSLPAPPELVLGVADLDLLRWPEALALLESDQACLAAMQEPVRCLDGSLVQSYTAWWVRTYG
jgi:hypothetical protein